MGKFSFSTIEGFISIRITNSKSTFSSQQAPEQTKETETNKEKIYTGHAQVTSHSGVSLPKPNTAQNQQIIPKESTGRGSTWFQDLWNSAAQSLIRWLYIGIEWPKDFNEAKFTGRTITTADLICPADGVSWLLLLFHPIRIEPSNMFRFIVMVMVFIYRIFYMIYSNAVYMSKGENGHQHI